MVLQIRIKKERGKPSTLMCTREDGSITYSKIQINFEIHDIAHYVIEKQLRLKNAFYGLLAKGYQIDDFMLPKDERPELLQPQNLPTEALATEHLVNLLTIDFMQTDSDMDISKTLDDILKENDLSFPDIISSKKVITMQKELAELMDKWNELPNNKTLKMILEL